MILVTRRVRRVIDLAHAAYSPIQSLFSMDADSSKLRESRFRMQKIDRFVRVQDADNSGDISRADFARMTERYNHTIMFNPQKKELYSKLESEIFKRWNFTDESVTLSYAEFKEKLIEDLSKGETFNIGSNFSSAATGTKIKPRPLTIYTPPIPRLF